MMPDPAPHQLLKQERGTWIWREPDPEGGARVIKLYRHRGAFNALRSKATRHRVQREYARLRHLERWGIPCTQPLGWVQGHSRRHGFWEALVMREVPDAVALDARLETSPAADALAPLFRIVRRMHDSGLVHQTLYARNILVRREAPPDARFFLADMPRSWLFPRSVTGTVMAAADLIDLLSTLREAGLAPAAIPLEAYVEGGLGAYSGPSPQALRRAAHSRGKLPRRWRDLRTRLRWLAAWTLNVGRGPMLPSVPVSPDVDGHVPPVNPRE